MIFNIHGGINLSIVSRNRFLPRIAILILLSASLHFLFATIKRSSYSTVGDSIWESPGLTYVPVNLTQQDEENYKWYTEAKLRELAVCKVKRSCPSNADKIAIFGAYHCHAAMFEGYMGGEGAKGWYATVPIMSEGATKAFQIDSLERQGFTVLLARDDWKYINHIHRQIPDLVKVIIGGQTGPMGDARTIYKSKGNPDGIPAWKHFHFSYFPHIGESLVGDKWTICAEPPYRAPEHNFPNYTFAGYPLEPSPSNTKVVPFEARPHRAYILSKRVQYFYQWANPMWEPEYFTMAKKELSAIWPDFEFVGGFVDDRPREEVEAQGPMRLPDGVKNLGFLDADCFDEEISKARIMIGLGWPTTSPSPYRALARGVPFLNPFKMGAFGSRQDPSTWSQTQHETLKMIDLPYVYHTEAYNYDQFLQNIKTAMMTPIPPFRFEWHSHEAVDARMNELMYTDWESEAARILELRQAGIETQEKGGGGQIGMFDM